MSVLFEALADEHSSNWIIARDFELSMTQVIFLRNNFKQLYIQRRIYDSKTDSVRDGPSNVIFRVM